MTGLLHGDGHPAQIEGYFSTKLNSLYLKELAVRILQLGDFSAADNRYTGGGRTIRAGDVRGAPQI